MLARIFRYVLSPYTNGKTHISHKEAFTASSGAFFAISLIFTLTIEFTNDQTSAALIAASIGASTFLIFTQPNSVFSQNWCVIGGHLSSALIGVSCYKLLGGDILATALSVSLSVIGMHLLRCPHPPGGATALLAVTGGEPVTQLGYTFAVFPILMNVLALLATAHIFNWLFKQLAHDKDRLKFKQLNMEQTRLEKNSFTFIKLEDASRRNENLLHQGMLYSHSSNAGHTSISKVTSIYNNQVSYEIIHGLTKGKIDSAPLQHFMTWARFIVVENQHAA